MVAGGSRSVNAADEFGETCKVYKGLTQSEAQLLERDDFTEVYHGVEAWLMKQRITESIMATTKHGATKPADTTHLKAGQTTVG